MSSDQKKEEPSEAQQNQVTNILWDAVSNLVGRVRALEIEIKNLKNDIKVDKFIDNLTND